MPASDVKPAVVLLSGGLDSATTLAVARSEGYRLHALSIDYGQRSRIELEAAGHVARSVGVAEHRVMRVDLSVLGGSALTGATEVPKDRTAGQITAGVPVTYVPARNTVFLACALAWAEVLEAFDLFIGVNAIDYSGYPDCRPEYIRAFESVANLGTRAGVEGAGRFRVHAPLIDKTKAEIIRLGVALGVEYGVTHTCYDPPGGGRACGRCDACTLRRRGFAEAGLPDPIEYVA